MEWLSQLISKSLKQAVDYLFSWSAVMFNPMKKTIIVISEEKKKNNHDNQDFWGGREKGVKRERRTMTSPEESPMTQMRSKGRIEIQEIGLSENEFSLSQESSSSLTNENDRNVPSLHTEIKKEWSLPAWHIYITKTLSSERKKWKIGRRKTNLRRRNEKWKKRMGNLIVLISLKMKKRDLLILFPTCSAITAAEEVCFASSLPVACPKHNGPGWLEDIRLIGLSRILSSWTNMLLLKLYNKILPESKLRATTCGGQKLNETASDSNLQDKAKSENKWIRIRAYFFHWKKFGKRNK